MDDIRKSIVGIFGRQGLGYQFAGTGFLVQDSNGLILTCSHVIDDAALIGDDIITFQFEGDERIFTAKIIARSDKDALDIVVLRPSVLLDGIPQLPLKFSSNSKGNEFSVFGYPQKGSFTGLHGVGKILGQVRDNKKRDALEISSNQVTHGFSGCPVWDEKEKAVVGIVSRGFDFGHNKPLGDVSFAIPIEIIKYFYSDLCVISDSQLNSVLSSDPIILLDELYDWKEIHNQSQILISNLDTVINFLNLYYKNNQLDFWDHAGHTWEENCVTILIQLPDEWHFKFAWHNDIDELFNDELPKLAEINRLFKNEINDATARKVYNSIRHIRSKLWNILTVSDKRIKRLIPEIRSQYA